MKFTKMQGIGISNLKIVLSFVSPIINPFEKKSRAVEKRGRMGYSSVINVQKTVCAAPYAAADRIRRML